MPGGRALIGKILSLDLAHQERHGWGSFAFRRPTRALLAVRLAFKPAAALCHTASGAFHEAFWVVTGTAAPVVALAAVVSMRDMNDYSYRRGTELRALRDEFVANGLNQSAVDDELKDAYFRLIYIGSLWVLQAANVCLQAALLAIALVSIQQSNNLLPPWVAITGGVIGLMLLAVTVLAEGNIKRMSSIIQDFAQRKLQNQTAEANGLGGSPPK